MARWKQVARNVLLVVVTSMLLPAISHVTSGDEGQDTSEASRQTSTPPESASRSSSQASRELSELLGELGTKADLPEARNKQPAGVALFASAARQLLLLSAEQRYEQFKKWTLPEGSRQTVRLLAVLVPHDAPPPEFPAVSSLEFAKQGVLNSADLLVDAAREAGKLDELAEELFELSDLDVEGAETLHLLVEIARGQGSEFRDQIARRQAGLPAKIAQSGQARPVNRQTIPWEDYLLARACTTDPALRGLGENMLRLLATFPHYWSNLSDAMITYAVRDFDDSVSARRSGEGEKRDQDPGLALWHPVSHLDSAVHRLGWVRPRWVVEGDTLRHVVGPEYDFLYFKYPLTGSFELSFDTHNSPQFFGSGAWGGVSYNGCVAEPRTLGLNQVRT